MESNTTEAAILDRLISPASGSWSPAAAEAILSLRFGEDDQVRMTDLLELAKNGVISASDADELEHYRHVGKLLELMKSRARRSLQGEKGRS
jgi:hypothetical protein